MPQAASAGPTEPIDSGSEPFPTGFGLPILAGLQALPAELFGESPGLPAAVEATTAAPSLAASEPTPGMGPQTDDSETHDAAGTRHVDDRDLIAAVHRRMVIERERVGGFGALIR